MRSESREWVGVRRVGRETVTRFLGCLVGAFTVFQSTQSLGASSPARGDLERLPGLTEFVFCVRLKYDDPHWYANIGYYCNNEGKKAYAGNGRPDVGHLWKYNLRSGELEIIAGKPGGTVRDPQVHYDGQRVLFSWRRAESDYFHLYEVNTDGSGLRQITEGPFDDYEPTYLPDGEIAFVSTRCRRWVNCWMTQVGIIYRCDADGRNMYPLSANTEHDNTPWVLPDGRILYTRWEYVDRSQVDFHGLWTMNPDGTGQTVYFGNMHPRTVMIDAKPIAGTRDVLASFSPGHGANEHAGLATVVSPRRGPDDQGGARPLHKGRLLRDPYPLSPELVLAARGRQILTLDTHGQERVVFRYPGEGEVHEPRPVMKRERERVIPPRTEPESTVGQMIVADVYEGRNLAGVEAGDIKRLLILESLPKPVNFSGGPDLTSWLGTFTLERVLGTVPVEPDGSAYFEVPPNRQLFFVTLDADDRSVKRMQSFTCAMPGEVISCVGCHEHRVQTPASGKSGSLMALARPASRIRPFEGQPAVLDFPRDIQPILDQHCVECHNYTRREGRVILVGDLGPHWSHSYFSLLAHRQVADGRNGLGNQAPRSIGSAASPLLEKARAGHYDTRVSEEEWRRLWLWIESGAPYAGTYAALRNEAEQQNVGRALGHVLGGGGDVLRRRCASCHDLMPRETQGNRPIPFNYELRQKNRSILGRPTAPHERLVIENDPQARFSANILVNLSRPEFSPLILGPLAEEAGGFGSCGSVFADRQDPDYEILLQSLRQAQAAADATPRYATGRFRPNAQYLREMKRFGVLPPEAGPTGDEADGFALDRDYWRLTVELLGRR